MGLQPSETGVLVIGATFGNITYLGLPVLTGLYGNEAAKYALFYDLLATTPLLWFVGCRSLRVMVRGEGLRSGNPSGRLSPCRRSGGYWRAWP